MKRPAVFLSILFISIIGSTALVSTAISAICRNFYKNETEKTINVKSTPADKQVKDEFKQASFKS
ncbi:MAG: hypothetical protein ACHQFX_05470 [Chitinophagales bacterium]